MLTLQRLFFLVDTVICSFLILGIIFVWFSREEHEVFASVLVLIGIPWLSVDPFRTGAHSKNARDSPLNL